MPNQIGLTDVERLEFTTAQFRQMGSQYGGGSCRDAVVAHVQAAQQMLRSSLADGVAERLYTALADLHTVAGWASFDMGLHVPAQLHFRRALEQARYAEQPSLVAKVLYCTGRVELGQGHGLEALRLFQLGQVTAQESGSSLAASLLAANEALAFAMLGETDQAISASKRAVAEFGRGGHEVVPVWFEFYDTAELQSLVAATYATLPEPTAQQRQVAIEGLYVATAMRDSMMVRSRALDLIELARLLTLAGKQDEAARVAKDASELAEQVRSMRVAERIAQSG